MIAAMSHDPPPPNTVRLWMAASQAELDLVANSHWRARPSPIERPGLVAFANRQGATNAVREQLVPSDGIGYVVRCEYHDQMGPTGDAWLLHATDIGEFNANIVGAIREEAEFRGPVTDSEFDDAQALLGFAFPPAWRAFLQSPSWFRRSWLESGWYVWLNPPRESVELHHAWATSVPLHPGVMAGTTTRGRATTWGSSSARSRTERSTSPGRRLAFSAMGQGRVVAGPGPDMVVTSMRRSVKRWPGSQCCQPRPSELRLRRL
jgi:hypothetical protein